ncbi:hypothetical protein [Microvirga pakistanensis]|uniref:hypothetical protein n=1 Tax=Microvirga pakistanensis TaxID=1682650 RepID=UPI00106C1A22|nr:hypothetical protein [Microvirga pakistanensis]
MLISVISSGSAACLYWDAISAASRMTARALPAATSSARDPGAQLVHDPQLEDVGTRKAVGAQRPFQARAEDLV